MHSNIVVIVCLHSGTLSVCSELLTMCTVRENEI